MALRDLNSLDLQWQVCRLVKKKCIYFFFNLLSSHKATNLCDYPVFACHDNPPLANMDGLPETSPKNEMASPSNYDIFSVTRCGQSRRSPSPSLCGSGVQTWLRSRSCRGFYSRRSQFPFRCAFAATALSEHALHYRFRQLRSRRFGARFGSRLDHLSARVCLPGCRWPARHLAGVFEAERPKKIPTKFRKDRNPSNSLF